MTDGELAELLRAVLARPDDHDVLSVYADVLIARGDPRGELIVVQLARAAGDTAALARREDELATLLTAALAAEVGQDLAIDWRLGFIDAIEVTRTPLAPTFQLLAKLPAARRIRRIMIRYSEAGWRTLAPELASLARLAPKQLRELVLQVPPMTSIGELGQLSRALPALEVLEIVGKDYNLGAATLTSLRRLVLTEARNYELAPLSHMKLPRLEELELACDASSDYDGLLSRELPRLRRLSLATTNRGVMLQLVREAPTSKLAFRVRTLALRGMELDRDAVDHLVANAKNLARLERFEVAVTGKQRRRLEEALGGVLVVC